MHLNLKKGNSKKLLYIQNLINTCQAKRSNLAVNCELWNLSLFTSILRLACTANTKFNWFFLKFGELEVFTASSPTEDLTKNRNVITRYLKSPSDISPLSLSSSSGSHTQLLPRSVLCYIRGKTLVESGRCQFISPWDLKPCTTRSHALSLTICVVDYNTVHGKYKLHTFYLNSFCCILASFACSDKLQTQRFVVGCQACEKLACNGKTHMMPIFKCVFNTI